MSLLQQTKKLLHHYNISPKKRFGQNFIGSSELLPRLASYANLNRADTVLEVGAGLGFLTRVLAEKGQKVVAVEIDPMIFSALTKELEGIRNVELVLGDVLKIAIPPFDKVVSIPPYQISSKLLFWLLKQSLECAVLVFQKEFAERLIAEVGSKDYGRLTVLAYYKVEVELLEHVPKHMFYPQPKVDSVVMRLTPRKTKPFNARNEQVFAELLQATFTQRNKKLRNVLMSYLTKKGFNEEGVKEIVNSLVFRDKRVRELAPEDFGAIANALSQESLFW